MKPLLSRGTLNRTERRFETSERRNHLFLVRKPEQLVDTGIDDFDDFDGCGPRDRRADAHFISLLRLRTRLADMVNEGTTVEEAAAWILRRYPQGLYQYYLRTLLWHGRSTF